MHADVVRRAAQLGLVQSDGDLGCQRNGGDTVLPEFTQRGDVARKLRRDPQRSGDGLRTECEPGDVEGQQPGLVRQFVGGGLSAAAATDAARAQNSESRSTPWRDITVSWMTISRSKGSVGAAVGAPMAVTATVVVWVP